MKSTLQSISVSSILTKPQVREYMSEEDQVSLALSIKHNGVLVPLLGHKEGSKIILDDGHRRLDAAKRVGLDTVPMIVSGHTPSPSERIQFQLLANAHRVDLGVIERARAIEHLMQETGWSASEVSAKLGETSQATISKLLTILVLPRGVQDLIDTGKLPMSSAYTIATVKDSSERQRLVDEVITGRLSRDRLVKHVKANRRGKKNSSKSKRIRPPKQRARFALGQGRSITISAPSLTTHHLISLLNDLAKQITVINADKQSLEDVVETISKANTQRKIRKPAPVVEDPDPPPS